MVKSDLIVKILKSNIHKNEFLADCIFFFHIFVVLFIIFTPLLNVPPAFLILHIVSCFSLYVHWVGNSNVCSLTILEGQLRGMDRTDTFTHRFIAPVYEIGASEWSTIIWIITTIVLCISLYKLYHSEKVSNAWDCYNSLPIENRTWVYIVDCFKPVFVL
jgi:hypothetical protein